MKSIAILACSIYAARAASLRAQVRQAVASASEANASSLPYPIFNPGDLPNGGCFNDETECRYNDKWGCQKKTCCDDKQMSTCSLTPLPYAQSSNRGHPSYPAGFPCLSQNLDCDASPMSGGSSCIWVRDTPGNLANQRARCHNGGWNHACPKICRQGNGYCKDWLSGCGSCGTFSLSSFGGNGCYGSLGAVDCRQCADIIEFIGGPTGEWQDAGSWTAESSLTKSTTITFAEESSAQTSFEHSLSQSVTLGGKLGGVGVEATVAASQTWAKSTTETVGETRGMEEGIVCKSFACEGHLFQWATTVRSNGGKVYENDGTFSGGAIPNAVTRTCDYVCIPHTLPGFSPDLEPKCPAKFCSNALEGCQCCTEKWREGTPAENYICEHLL